MSSVCDAEKGWGREGGVVKDWGGVRYVLTVSCPAPRYRQHLRPSVCVSLQRGPLAISVLLPVRWLSDERFRVRFGCRLAGSLRWEAWLEMISACVSGKVVGFTGIAVNSSRSGGFVYRCMC